MGVVKHLLRRVMTSCGGALVLSLMPAVSGCTTLAVVEADADEAATSSPTPASASIRSRTRRAAILVFDLCVHRAGVVIGRLNASIDR